MKKKNEIEQKLQMKLDDLMNDFRIKERNRAYVVRPKLKIQNNESSIESNSGQVSPIKQ